MKYPYRTLSTLILAAALAGAAYAGEPPHGTKHLQPAAIQPGEPPPATGNMISHRVYQMDDAGGPAKPRGKTLRVTGRLTQGVECPVLRTADGKIYTLAGKLKGWKTGDRVTVTGTLAQASTCQQGTTIDVLDIRPPKKKQ